MPREDVTADLDLESERSGPMSLGTYQLIAEIARGGMGRVCLCRRAGEAGFQRLFALKLMHPHLASEAEFVDMLLDEAHLAARINHPNVVGIVDLGRYEGGYFLVMDYIEGASLYELLARRRVERSPSLIVPVAIDALRGLAAAHAQTDEFGEPLGIVHRDVSPHNVLVGVDGTARLTDFGIAKATARISSTRPGTRKGKFEYMAPEQITSGECDVRTDVFSFGVMLWNALTGERLFRSETDAGTLHNVLNLKIAAPSTVGLRPPACFDDAVMRALERDPSKRTASADELAAELKRAASSGGLIGSREDVGAWVKEVFDDQLRARRALIASSHRASRRALATIVRGELEVAEASPLPRLSTSLPPPPPTGTSPTIAEPMRRRARRSQRFAWALAAIALGISAVLAVALVSFAGTAAEAAPAEVAKLRKPPPILPPIPIPMPMPMPIVASEPAVEAPPPRRPSRARRARRPRRVRPLERMDNNPYLSER
jgi:serine/threonine protein kinase